MSNEDSIFDEISFTWRLTSEQLQNPCLKFEFLMISNPMIAVKFTAFGNFLRCDKSFFMLMIKKQGLGFLNTADITVIINKNNRQCKNVKNWKGFSDVFVFDNTDIQFPYNITFKIKFYENNDDNVENISTSILPNMKNYLFSSELSDIKIKVNNEEFPAHKIVLACNSRVFMRMFDTDMKEKRENCININEFDADSIKEVLRFLYEGKVQADNDCDVLLKLLSFADMYQIDRLKDYCELTLIKSFQVDNIVKILVTVENYDVVKLKDTAMEFLIKNKANVYFDDAIDNVHNSTVLRNFFSHLAQMKKCDVIQMPVTLGKD